MDAFNSENHTEWFFWEPLKVKRTLQPQCTHAKPHETKYDMQLPAIKFEIKNSGLENKVGQSASNKLLLFQLQKFTCRGKSLKFKIINQVYKKIDITMKLIEYLYFLSYDAPWYLHLCLCTIHCSK